MTKGGRGKRRRKDSRKGGGSRNKRRKKLQEAMSLMKNIKASQQYCQVCQAIHKKKNIDDQLGFIPIVLNGSVIRKSDSCKKSNEEKKKRAHDHVNGCKR